MLHFELVATLIGMGQHGSIIIVMYILLIDLHGTIYTARHHHVLRMGIHNVVGSNDVLTATMMRIVAAESCHVHCQFRIDGLFLDWLDNYHEENKLAEFKFEKEQIIEFEYTKEQLSVRNDIFRRYGRDINALSKIVTRISNLESQFRKVKYKEDNNLRDIYKKKVSENFVKYALSN